jgi:hypothetical protein
MKRVATGELEKRLRNCAFGQLTENPERSSLGVLSFPASSGKGIGVVARLRRRQRARCRRSICAGRKSRRREGVATSPVLFTAPGAS